MRSEDGSIIQECLNGKPEAFGILVDKYKAGIYAFVYSELRNFHDAQDVTQDVFLYAYTGLRNLRIWESFSFWIYCIANNLCKKWIRSRSRRPDKDFIEDQDPKAVEAPSLSSHHEDLIYQSLQEILDSLPEDYRQVLTLHYLGGMKIKDMAETLGVSPAAIGKRLSRARAMLREEMVAMMGTAYEGQKLRSTFTFRIVEMVKRIKIQPTSTMKGLPWGLSFAVGLIITIMSINPTLISFEKVGTPVFSPMPAETKVLKVGEIPVDVIKTSNIALISSSMEKGNGGELKPDIQNAFLAPQGEGGTWVKKADMPTPRVNLATGVVNGKIYAIGGWDLGPTAFSTIEEYNPETDTWDRKADKPTAIDGPSASVVDGRIYAIGGWTNGGIVNNPIMEVYDPKTDEWSRKADMPTGRSYLSTNVVNGKIYAIGGMINQQANVCSTVEEYDPSTDTWTRKADMPTGRCYFSTSVVNGNIYAIGGNAGVRFLSNVEEYNPVTDTWTRKADMPTARCPFTSAVNDRIYAIGGGSNLIHTVVEEYDPATDKWTKKTDMPTARCYLPCTNCVVNGKIYVIGGTMDGRSTVPTVEEYTPEGWPFSISPQDKLPKTWGKLKAK